MTQAALMSPESSFHSNDYGRYKLIDLFKEVRLLMGQQHALEYRLSTVLRELDQRDGLDGRPLHLASWLAHHFGMGYGAAREKVRTARADNEARLLRAAAIASTDGVERMVRLAKQRECLDDVQQMLRQRALTYAWQDDGSLLVKARLTPEQGAIWIKAFEQAESNQESNQGANDSAGDEDFAAHRADVMTQALAETLVHRSDAKPQSSGDRYQVMVHVSAETLPSEVSVGTSTVSNSVAHIEGGPYLHAETVRRLTCDGALVSVLEDDQGTVLNVGRKTRVIPTAIKRALRARDGCCQYPGCSQTRFIDGHHIVHWADGGETKLENLLLICRRHHTLVHEYGYQITKSDDGFEFSKGRALDIGRYVTSSL